MRGARVRLFDHVLAIHGLEAAAARQVVAHQLRHVERAAASGDAERHDGDRNGVGLSFRDLDHEFRPGRREQINMKTDRQPT